MKSFERSLPVFTFVYISFVAKTLAKDNTDCTTQDEKPGQCVRLEQCAPLLNLKNTKPYTAQTATYLQKSICGFEDSTRAKVCCPMDNHIISDYGKIDFKGPITSKYLPNPTECGTIAYDRVINGEKTKVGEYPWMALLEYQTPQGKRFSCGGALISNRYILTAAHCVTGVHVPRNWTLSSVRLAEHNLTTEEECFDTADPVCFKPQDFKIEEKIVHEGFDSTTVSQYHDIALLRLDKNVTFADFVRPICIPTTEDLLNRTYIDIPLTVAGWGATEDSSQSDELLQQKVVVKSNSECATVYRSRFNIGQGQFCAGGEGGKDSCKGDSGGPLMVVDISNVSVSYYAVGIVSFGPVRCGLENWPSIYTKVAPYVPWIVSKLKP